ncbi:MAG: sialidase family protein [Herpetosiphon sp.]
MNRKRVALFSIVSLLLGMSVFSAAPAARADENIVQKVVKGTYTPPAVNTNAGPRAMPKFSNGIVNAASDDLRAEQADLAGGSDAPLAVTGPGISPGTLGCSRRDRDNGNNDGNNTGNNGNNGNDSNGDGNGNRGNRKENVRVNQDCTFRRQAEEQIIFNPADPNNLLAGQNDSRVGFNQCGIDWSTDNGKHWGDLLPPFRQKINFPARQEPTAADPNRHTIKGGPGTLHTYDAGSDPTVAFDTQGQGFFSCIAFDVTTDASMLYVTASPAGAQGSFFFNIPTFSRKFIVAEDNSPEVFHDKQFITVDTNPGSPNRDNVYVTWTVFRFSPSCGPQPNPRQEERYCSSPIFGSMSTDHARTWSTPEEISGTSAALCFMGDFFDPTRTPGACDFNQGSDPRTLPNGDLQVIFNNSNTDVNNVNNQQLGVHCRPGGSSPDGTARLNCVSPSKVGDDVSFGEPQCNFGRGPEECIPGAFIRTNDFPRLAVNPANGNLFATWQDYRNGEFDIQLSKSIDGGLTWTEVGTVNPDRGLDHYMPAIDLAKIGEANRVGDSYYRTERIPNENNVPAAGFAPGVQPGVKEANSDYVLAGGTDGQTPYNFAVVSPVFPPPDGIQEGFNGDYSGLTINKGTQAHPIWSDTRNVNPYPENGVIHDEDVFTDMLNLPNGQPEVTNGRIGRR